MAYDVSSGRARSVKMDTDEAERVYRALTYYVEHESEMGQKTRLVTAKRAHQAEARAGRKLQSRILEEILEQKKAAGIQRTCCVCGQTGGMFQDIARANGDETHLGCNYKDKP